MVSPLIGENLLGLPTWILAIVVIWTLIWKGLALWKAAHKNHKIWFVGILVLNTMGILEILYIFLFSKLDFNKTEKEASKTKKKRK